MTDHTTTTTERASMKTVTHTHPETAGGLRRLYARGDTVAADGGRANARPPEAADAADAGDAADAADAADPDGDGEMEDVDHVGEETEPNRVFERGGEFDDEDE